jgi:glucose dehydrogenase
MNPAIDPRLRMLYFGVGNPVPQWGGEIRPGNNLFTDSVVALDIRTGKLKWYFQGVHHDIWDHDFGTPLVLFDTAVNGQQRHGLAVMRTDGYLFQLDRETGAPLRPIVERRVPSSRTMKMSPTQPFPIGVDAIGPRCVEEGMAPAAFKRRCYFDALKNEPNLVFAFATTRAAPMSFSPQTGYFYITAGVTPNWLRRSDDPCYYGIFQPTVGLRQYGLVTALDSQTGKIIWQKRVANRLDAGSGATSKITPLGGRQSNEQFSNLQSNA